MQKQIILVFIVAFFISVGCTKYTDLKDANKNDMLGVLGEICDSDDSISVNLFWASKISDSISDRKPLQEASVVLFDSQNTKLATFQNAGNGRWVSKYKLGAQRQVSLKIIGNKKEWNVKTEIPKDFSASLTNNNFLGDGTFDISLKLTNSNSTTSYYVLEFLSIDNAGVKNLRNIESSDKYTDNKIYNEIGIINPRIFLRTNLAENTLTFKVYGVEESSNNLIRVKSVDQEYYKFLYNYEVQKSRGNFNIPFVTGSPDYAGVFGGCVVKTIPFK